MIIANRIFEGGGGTISQLRCACECFFFPNIGQIGYYHRNRWHLRSSSTAGGRAALAAGPEAESFMLTSGIRTRLSLEVKPLLNAKVSSGPEIPLP